MIITSIHNLDLLDVDPFFSSLRRHYDGQVIVIAGTIGQSTITYLSRMKATVAFVTPDSRYWHWNNFRFLMLERLLMENKIDFGSSRKVLLCDSRDVMFQCSPFDSHYLNYGYQNGEGIHVAMENNVVKRSRGNLKWIIRSCGMARAWQMRNTVVSCAGTIILDPKSLVKFSKVMSLRIQKHPFVGKWSGLDQALYNELLWENSLEMNKHFHPNWKGPFLTLDSEPRRQKDTQGRWINDDGSVIPVIHQWDRI